MAKGLAPIDHSKAAISLIEVLHNNLTDGFNDLTYISYVELRSHTPLTATNQEYGKDMVEALMIAGAIPQRDLKKVRFNPTINIPVIDLHKVLKYIMEIRGLLKPIEDEFVKPTKKQMAKLIAYTGNTYSKVCEPGWYKGIYNLFFCS